MSLKSFISELKKGLKLPSYLLYSPDSYLLTEAVRMIKETVPESERDFRLDVFDATEARLSEVADAIRAVPFFGGRKTVILENSQKLKLKEIKPLEDYMSAQSPDALLVMTFRGDRDDRKKLDDLTARLKPGKSVSVTLGESEIPEWIKSSASEKGIQLANDAVELMIAVIGPEAGLLAPEIEKAANLGKADIGAADLRPLLSGTGGYDAFDFVEAVIRRDGASAFRIYSLIERGIDKTMFLGALNWGFTGPMAKQFAEEMPQGRLEKIMRILGETDASVKSHGGYYPLEYMIYRLLKA